MAEYLGRYTCRYCGQRAYGGSISIWQCPTCKNKGCLTSFSDYHMTGYEKGCYNGGKREEYPTCKACGDNAFPNEIELIARSVEGYEQD